MIYASAKPELLKMLDPIHNAALRLASGAYRTCPIQSLHCETNEPTLNDRRTWLMLKYFLKVKSSENHPNKYLLTNGTGLIYFTKNIKRPKSLAPRLFLETTRLRIDFPQIIAKKNNPQKPPWTQLLIPVINEFTLFPKSITADEVFQKLFSEIKNTLLLEHKLVFTDGSKLENTVGCAFIAPGVRRRYQLHTYCSSFTAEMIAIEQATNFIGTQEPGKYAICTDSLSSINTITTYMPKNNLVINVRQHILELTSKGFEVVLMWIPSHVGIGPNEDVDLLANEARLEGEKIETISLEDGAKAVKKVLTKHWQLRWSHTTEKLKQVKSAVEEWQTVYRSSRQEEKVLTRLRTGHSKITHEYLIKKSNPPVCQSCHCDLTINHILTECPQNIRVLRTLSNTKSSIKDLLKDEESSVRIVIKYLKKIHLFNLI